MFVFPGRAPVVQGSLRSARNYLLTYQDYFDVRNTAPYVREASPVLTMRLPQGSSRYHPGVRLNGQAMRLPGQAIKHRATRSLGELWTAFLGITTVRVVAPNENG